jgi:sugar phosphate isomerase/epimerase
MEEVKVKRFRIGNQTSYAAAKPIVPFEYAVINHFDAFEWFPDKKETGAGFDLKEIESKTRCHIREVARDHDISLSVHAPLKANPLTDEGQAVLMETFKFTHEIGAALLNIHLDSEKKIGEYAKALRNIADRFVEFGIKLSIENTPLTGPDDFNNLFTIFRNCRSSLTEYLGMCLDLGHANLCHATRNHYLRFLDWLDPQIPIIHVHLHENAGDEDSHLPIFTGPSQKDESGIREFINRLKERHFSGSIILEQWPEPPSLLVQARDRLHRMFDAKKQQNSHRVYLSIQ